MPVQWIFLVLVLWTVPSTSLICYHCWCTPSDISDCNCTNTTIALDGSYCTIVEDLHSSNPYLELATSFENASYSEVDDPYYILVDESIFYNETTSIWEIKTRRVTYGCDWDYCNEYSLISILPNSFKLSIDEQWLTNNIYGTGSTTHCYTCPDETCGNQTHPINYDPCTITSCDNSTTCSLYSLWHDLAIDESCYYSECTSPAMGDEFTEDNEKYQVTIEAIVYLSHNRSNFQIWQLGINCAVDNCSRPSIFQEIKNQIKDDMSNLTIFPNVPPSTVSPPSTLTSVTTPVPPTQTTLSCYECACYDNPDCACNTVKPTDYATSYCTIVRVNYESGHFTVDLEHIDRNSTRVYIRKFPYVLAEESILYNETTEKWTTRTNILVYGCNWNLCNHPSLVKLLPNSFQMTLSDEWLNENILYNGSSTRDCHECPEAAQCGTTDFLDASRCAVKPCNTTCIVSDLFDDPDSTELCYQSYCAAPDSDPIENQHRVEIEGIIYGDQPETVELWEIDLYCRADDCSRPEIFNEIRRNLTLETNNNLTLLFDNSSGPLIEPQIICYECFCFDDPNCKCDTYTAYSANQSYCTIIRENFEDGHFGIVLEHINRDSTRVYIREFPYLLVEESIIYNETTKVWNTINNIVMFGCNQDYCNSPSLLPDLPDSFQMRLPDEWLNTNVLGTGQTIRDCHECPEAPQCGTTDFLDSSRCSIKPCNTTCLVSDLFDDPDKNELCYQSFCAPPDSEFFQIDPHRVELEGIIYAKKPANVELWEIDIFCRADDCSRPDLFKELRTQLCIELGDYTAFFGNTSTIDHNNGTAICSAVLTSTTMTSTTESRTTTNIITTVSTPSRTTSSTSTIRTTTGTTTTMTTTTTTTTTITTTRITVTATVTTRTTSIRDPTTTTAHASNSVAHSFMILLFILISLININ